MHMYTEYEVSMSNHVSGGGVHRWCQPWCHRMMPQDDGESMIAQGSLVDKPNEPKIK